MPKKLKKWILAELEDVMYEEKDLVRVAKRENNKRRNYVVVNPLQGKHMPVSPGEALKLFDCLADKIMLEDADKVLFIGFAETATAIGMEIAIRYNAKYIQTTREAISDVDFLFFTESHSHATEQKLVKEDMDALIAEVEHIIFVEDEVTTGNTILNIVDIIDDLYDKQIKFSVASLINGMDEESLAGYGERNIDLYYIVKTSQEGFSDMACSYQGAGAYIEPDDNNDCEYNEILLQGAVNSRRCVSAFDYCGACERLYSQLAEQIDTKETREILIIGTEECMYPAIYVGKRFEESGKQVKTHSTTRSPITAGGEEGYPLRCRYELKSLYDSKRTTYIYDIAPYDLVVIITDSTSEEREGVNTLVNALKRKNEKIILVRWC